MKVYLTKSERKKIIREYHRQIDCWQYVLKHLGDKNGNY